MSLKARLKQLEERLGFVGSAEPKTPNIVVGWVAPVLDDKGNHVQGGQPCDPRTAQCNGKTFERLPGESVEGFTDRIIKSERKGLPLMVVMSDDEPVAREQ